MSPLLAHPEQAGLNALRPGSLYCYGMILYMDAQYTAKFRKLAGENSRTINLKSDRVTPS